MRLKGVSLGLTSHRELQFVVGEIVDDVEKARLVDEFIVDCASRAFAR
jgi:hypothetical protein